MAQGFNFKVKLINLESTLDRGYMQMALNLAQRARGFTSPNPMVGALVVKNNKIIGQGYHAKAGTPHAEIHALNEAGENTPGATLYVTLEPCCHQGRTEPCTKAILNSGVERVVVAMVDPNPLVKGKGIRCLKEGGLRVIVGVLEKEARSLNEVFVKYIVTRMPFVLLKAAMSLDGKIATRTGESKWITGSEARKYSHQLRNWYDAILVGVNTILRDDPALTARLPGEENKNPVRIVIDSKARTPLNARVVTSAKETPTLIAVTNAAPADKISGLEKMGVEVLPVKTNHKGRVDLKALMLELGRREITSVLIEGGGECNSSALKAGIVDKISWFIAPLIIGGQGAPGPVGGEGVASIKEAIPLKQITVKKCGQDIYVEGYLTAHQTVDVSYQQGVTEH
jgi:diaminohydroxyphosphoribosylaminopyrimidine deaminase/5-amino-6-(5-phosphoribosylamino)uracil reductase